MIALVVQLMFVSSIYTIDAATYLYSNNRLTESNDHLGRIEYLYDPNGNLIGKKKENNIFINAGFEVSNRANGVADGWNTFVSPEVVGQYEVVSNPVSEGSQSQKINVSDMPKAKQGMNIWQDTNVRGGSKYEVSGRVKLENMTNMQLSIVIHYFDQNNQQVGSQNVMDYKQNTMDWVKLSGILNVPTNATTARIHFHMNSTGEHGKGTAYVDGTALKLGGG